VARSASFAIYVAVLWRILYGVRSRFSKSNPASKAIFRNTDWRKLSLLYRLAFCVSHIASRPSYFEIVSRSFFHSFRIDTVSGFNATIQFSRDLLDSSSGIRNTPLSGSNHWIFARLTSIGRKPPSMATKIIEVYLNELAPRKSCFVTCSIGFAVVEPGIFPPVAFFWAHRVVVGYCSVAHRGLTHLLSVFLCQVFAGLIVHTRIRVFDFRLPYSVSVPCITLPFEKGLYRLLIVAFCRFFQVLFCQVTHPVVSVDWFHILDVLLFVLPYPAVEQIQLVHPAFRRAVAVSFSLIRIFTQVQHPLRQFTAVFLVRDFFSRVLGTVRPHWLVE